MRILRRGLKRKVFKEKMIFIEIKKRIFMIMKEKIFMGIMAVKR